MTGLWFKRSCALANDPAMQTVMMEHTALALPVFEELIAVCKLSRGEGRVALAYGVLGQRLFLSAAKVKRIVSALDAAGLVTIDREESDTKAFVADIPGWEKWNPKDPTGPDRKRKYRERRAVQSVPGTDDEDRSGNGEGTVEERIGNGPDRSQSKRESKRTPFSVATPTENGSDGVAPFGEAA